MGIVLRGNFEEGNATAAQVASLEKLLAAFKSACPDAGVWTHKRRKELMGLKSTECPGKNLIPEVERIAKKLGMEGR